MATVMEFMFCLCEYCKLLCDSNAQICWVNNAHINRPETVYLLLCYAVYLILQLQTVKRLVVKPKNGFPCFVM